MPKARWLRVNFRANGTAVTFLQELHYYPFGMVMEGIGTAEVTDNGYQYNGKEWNEDLGLNWNDYGARWYDVALGRWWAVDPLGEKQLSWSTYGYTMNNPIFFIDPNGMESEAAGTNFLEKWYGKQQQGNDGGQKSKDNTSSDWYPEEKDGKVSLVAEEGDDEKSLKKWANGAFSDTEISKLYGTLKNGKVDLSGTFVRSVLLGFIAEAAGCEFNCFSSVESLVMGTNKSTGWGEVLESEFKNFALKYLSKSPISNETLGAAQPFKSFFGYTQLGAVGILDHVSINAGVDREGNRWVLNKDGYSGKFQFQKGTKWGQQKPDIIYNKKY